MSSWASRKDSSSTESTSSSPWSPMPVDGRLLEDHDVLGERARLVAEEDLDLAELLVEIGWVALGGLVGLLVVQVQVPGQE